MRKRIKNCIKYISMECLSFTFYIFETCKEEKRLINCNNLTAFVKKRLKNSCTIKKYESLTVNADLTEQLFSFTDRINK